ncbi:uncharacterized protein LOC143036560 [Oratosquilla oratoria]|uniref:uncharacterized protein LOC143036560 n=1 Tax=Oratosquilla oratoria TaxID=337810 RepID=UPI003F762138
MFVRRDIAGQMVASVVVVVVVAWHGGLALSLYAGNSVKRGAVPPIALPETRGCSDLTCGTALWVPQNPWTSFRTEKVSVRKNERQDEYAESIINVINGLRDTVFKKVNALQKDVVPGSDQSAETESYNLEKRGSRGSLPAQRPSGLFPPFLPIEAPAPPPMPRRCSYSPKRDDDEDDDDDDDDDDDKKDPNLPTIPPEVCGLCPLALHLEPCTCESLGTPFTGYIAITCPSEVSSQQHLKDLLRNTEFISTDVYRFIHNNSLISGAVTRDLWEPLRIVQLINNHDNYNFVDNHAFCPHGDTLKYISFYNNSIGYFHWESINFVEVPKLENLILAHNHLSMIPEDAMHHSGLQILDLSFNNINYMGKDAFAGLTRLDILDLGNNDLSRLEDFTLRMPDRVSYNTLQLDLSYNKISYISDYAMQEMKNCQVDLRGNQLVTLTQQVFEPIIHDSGSFAQFNVDGNPLHCDCSFKWLLSCKHNFDDARCTNINKTLHHLTIKDLGDC